MPRRYRPSRVISRGAALAVTASLGLVGGQGGDAEVAGASARLACLSPAPDVPAGLDLRRAPVPLLEELAGSARLRQEYAERAAASDARWRGLAEATAAITAFAGVLVDARTAGAPLDEAVTPEMWDQYKYGSDAFLAECRPAVAGL